MSELPEFERALSVILTEAEGCYCPHRDACVYVADPWCRHLVSEGGNVRIRQYGDLNIARCVYRERPGCCWVLDSVEKLARDYLKRGQIDVPPVPSQAIAIFDQRREIELRLVPLKAHHGACWLIGAEWVIQLNAAESRCMRRHTIFHEAFHIACRNASPAFKRFDLTDRKPFREILADHFAFCFLMPKEWGEERWPTVQDVRGIAHTFGVSISVMGRRLRQLGLMQRNQCLDIDY